MSAGPKRRDAAGGRWRFDRAREKAVAPSVVVSSKGPSSEGTSPRTAEGTPRLKTCTRGLRFRLARGSDAATEVLNLAHRRAKSTSSYRKRRAKKCRREKTPAASINGRECLAAFSARDELFSDRRCYFDFSYYFFFFHQEFQRVLRLEKKNLNLLKSSKVYTPHTHT